MEHEWSVILDSKEKINFSYLPKIIDGIKNIHVAMCWNTNLLPTKI